ncbi:conserved inner membrane protein [Vibrio parahaemolyticus AQ4037]|nr:conserved inner membrane protein [Vibrio parahaemolyticus AQ4037]
MKSTSTLLGLTIFYAIVFLFSALEPSSRAVWFAEITPAIGILIAIWAISIRYQFSNTAYLLMFIWLCLHTIGAKYTFAEVPFDWFNNLIGSERNNFDRVAHFAIGLYAYPIAEYLIRNKKFNPTFSCWFALFAIMSLAAATKSLSGGMPNWLVAMKHCLPSSKRHLGCPERHVV